MELACEGGVGGCEQRLEAQARRLVEGVVTPAASIDTRVDTAEEALQLRLRVGHAAGDALESRRAHGARDVARLPVEGVSRRGIEAEPVEQAADDRGGPGGEVFEEHDAQPLAETLD